MSSYDLMDELNKVHKEYLKKFGEHSLDRVFYMDPVDLSKESILGAIEDVRHAIDHNEPFEQDSEEGLKNIVF